VKRGHLIANLDWVTILIFLVLLILGWFNIYSAVYSELHPSILDLDQRYGKQFLWIIAALVISVVVILIDYRFYEFFGYLIYGAAVFLLLFVLVAGREVNGAKSWFAIGAFQIQPSEFAKPAVALALAKYLSTFNINIHKFNTFIITAFIIFFPALLILIQPDTGSALIFFAFILPIYRQGFSGAILLVILSLGILFLLVLVLDDLLILGIILCVGFIAYRIISESSKKTFIILLYYLSACGFIFGLFHLIGFKISYYLSGIIALGIGGLIFSIIVYFKRIRNVIYIILGIMIAVIFTSSVDYSFHNYLSKSQQHRVNIMLGIESDPLGAGYNVNQSMIAIGSGGLTGKGYLKGTQTKLRFVPEQSTDFIFCTVGEEWGFLGTTVVILLFLILFYRLLVLAERQRNAFARIYGYGVVSVLCLHFVINIAMTIGIFPVIGIPLPFFSYGGSSLWAFTILLFIFIRMDASRMDSLT
jgi:rod shape determining protein RodA